MTELYMGIDPDKSGSAMALLGYQPVTRLITIEALGIIQGSKTGLDSTSQNQAISMAHAINLCGVTANDLVTVFIEGQSMSMGRSKGVRYQDIRDLAQISGVLYGVCSILLPNKSIICKEPGYWKQQVPKPIQQGRTLSCLGWEYTAMKDYAKPMGCAKMMFDLHSTIMIDMEKNANTEWKHVLDAMGMALFLLKKANPRHFV